MMSECLLFLFPGDIFLASRSDLGVSNCSKGTAVWIWFDQIPVSSSLDKT